MLALRLFLPERWTSHRARLQRAGVPAEYRTARTKPEIALAEIGRAIAAGVRFGCVVADAGYGLSAPFRQGLTARKLTWAVGIPRHLKVYPAEVQMIWPVAGRGRPRQRHVPDILSNGQCQMAHHQLAHRHERKAQGSFCRGPRACCGRTTAADQGQRSAASARRGGLAHRRTQNVGRKEVLLANLPAKTDPRTLER
jgi:hypothetical protein